jgi:hypothetical protein
MRTLVGEAFLPFCFVLAWLLLRRPLRVIVEGSGVERARQRFRQQRERLEARFLTALGRLDPSEAARWDDADWHDEVLWARDRQTRVLLALVGVRFRSDAFDDLGDPRPRHSTALFEYRRGRWLAEGKRLDEVRPDEAVLRNLRFEPVLTHPRRVD